MEPESGIDKKQKQKQKKMSLGDLEARKASLASEKYDPETLEIDHVAEKKLVRKLDLYIVPMVMLLYLLVCPSSLFPPPSPRPFPRTATRRARSSAAFKTSY
jgi:hypothetical protein